MAARAEVVFVSFVTGEISPKLDARVDLAKAPNAARKITNMTTNRYGRAERRAGTRFIAGAKGFEPATAADGIGAMIVGLTFTIL